jgi:hypothetical protein
MSTYIMFLRVYMHTIAGVYILSWNKYVRIPEYTFLMETKHMEESMDIYFLIRKCAYIHSLIIFRKEYVCILHYFKQSEYVYILYKR